MTTTRLQAIQAALAAGQSRRAIARSLGISDRTVRSVLAGADPADPADPAASAPVRSRDYIPPAERPTSLPVIVRGGVSYGLEPDPARTGCPYCGHVAWRTAPRSTSFECACYSPQGRACHATRKIFAPFPAAPLIG